MFIILLDIYISIIFLENLFEVVIYPVLGLALGYVLA